MLEKYRRNNMKITNKYNLNEVLVDAIQKTVEYSGEGEERFCSATQIINPVRIFWLTKRHKDEIVEDISEMLWRLLGSLLHLAMENANENCAVTTIKNRVKEFFDNIRDGMEFEEDTIMQEFMSFLTKDINIFLTALDYKKNRFIVEKRFKHVTKSGLVISGGVDLIDKENNEILDWKLTSVFTWIYRNRSGSRIEDYTKQLNIYRFLCEKVGINIDKLTINMMFRDFSKSKAKYEKDYPNQIEPINLDVWGLDTTEAFIEERVAEFEQYKDTPDDELPICTPEERWQSQTTWAVRKLKNKTASKVLFSYSKAKEWLVQECNEQAFKKTKMNSGDAFDKEYAKLFNEFTIEQRVGESVRCESYCSCKDFCSFYKSLEK
jgi:hypothetical protein